MGRHGGGTDDGWEISAPAQLHDVFQAARTVDGDGADDLVDEEPAMGRGVRNPRRGGLRGWGPRAVVVLLVAAAAVVGFRVAGAVDQRDDGEILVPGAASVSAGAQASTEAGADTGDEAADTGVQASPGAGDGTPGTASSRRIQVHVIGAVKRPGLYRLPGGARLDDAVRAAGGATTKADLAGVNLAQTLNDGIQVRVPTKGETPAAPDGGSGSGATGALPSGGAAGTGQQSGPGQQAGTGSGSEAPGAEAVVNLNTADLTALQTLPGVGPAMSQRLIDWREAHGPFTSASDLDAVPGIGPAMLAKLEGKVGYG